MLWLKLCKLTGNRLLRFVHEIRHFTTYRLMMANVQEEECKNPLVEPLTLLGSPPPVYDEDKASVQSIAYCRICFSGDEPNDVLISPCRCSGSMGYIHRSCLTRWLEQKKGSRGSAKCELCRFVFHRHKKFKVKSCRMPPVSRRDKILHTVFVINLLIMIGCAVATILCFLADREKVSQNRRQDKSKLTREEIITLTCGVLFFVSFFVAMAVQIKAKNTIYQLFVKFIVHNMEWQIDEYDKSKDRTYPPQFV